MAEDQAAQKDLLGVLESRIDSLTVEATQSREFRESALAKEKELMNQVQEQSSAAKTALERATKLEEELNAATKSHDELHSQIQTLQAELDKAKNSSEATKMELQSVSASTQDTLEMTQKELAKATARIQEL